MTRNTVKRLTKPLDEPEREFQRLRKVAMRSHQNESLAIAGRNHFDDEASSSNNTRAKLLTPPKTLHEHSRPNSSGLKNKDPLRHVKHYLSIIDNIQADGATRDTSRLIFFHFSLKGKVAEWLDRIPLTQIMTWDQLMSRFLNHLFPVPHHEIQKWLLVQIFYDNISRIDRKKVDQFTQFHFKSRTEEEGWNRIGEYNNPSEQVCLSGGDIYNDPSLLRFYQNDDTSLWGNKKRKEKGEDGPERIIRSKFEDELANFMLKNKSHAKRIGDMLVQHLTRSRISTQDPPFPAPPQPATDNFTKRETEKEGPEGEEPSIMQETAPRPSILYQPSKTFNLPFPSRLKKQKKDDEDERLLSIFKLIHINLPFREAMIHMLKEAKVLKDLLWHKEKLEKAASSVKLSGSVLLLFKGVYPKRKET
ncbi:hypothetical protein Tco_0204019 [Tanacetum coccineum]